MNVQRNCRVKQKEALLFHLEGAIAVHLSKKVNQKKLADALELHMMNQMIKEIHDVIHPHN